MDSGNDVLITTDWLLYMILADPDHGTPVILNFYCNDYISSVAILSAMNSAPNVELSIAFASCYTTEWVPYLLKS